MGKVFPCTGIALEQERGELFVGNVGQDQPESRDMQPTIVRLTGDFSTVLDKIYLDDAFPRMEDMQGFA